MTSMRLGAALKDARASPWLVRAALGAVVVLGSLTLGAVSPALGDFFTDESALGVLGGVILVFAAAAPLLWRLRRHGLDAPGLYALATCFFLGVTALAWLGTPERPGPGLDQSSISDALRLVACALLAFGLGTSMLGRARRPPDVELKREWAPPPWLLVGLYGVSVVGVLITFSLDAYGYISTPEARQSTAGIGAFLSLLASLGDVVLVVTALVYFRTRDRALLCLLIAFTALAVVRGFVGGDKATTMLPLALVIASYGLIRRQFPWRASIVVLIFLFMFVVPTNLRYREGVTAEQKTARTSLKQALTTPPEFSPVAAAANARDYIFSRFRSIDSVALVRTQTPSPQPFAGGARYLQLPLIIFVPRAVWAGKPVLGDAGEFTHTYGQVPDAITSATQITEVGDLYRNFGYVGTFIGAFLWGAIIAGLSLLYASRRSPRIEALYVYALFTVVVYVDSDLPALIATASKTLPFAFAVSWFLLPGRSDPPGYQRLRRNPAGSPASAR